ncbi:CCN family member 5-like [Gastrophryne carolinensis]
MLTDGGLLLIVALAQQIPAQQCPEFCSCSRTPPRCPPNVPLLLDPCGCCMICARRLGEVCTRHDVCDQSQELVCDYSASSDGGRTGTCNYNYGDGCDMDGRVYQDGEIFQPSCKLQCQCIQGGVTCVPLCSEDIQLPTPTCPFPRRVTVPGKCCPEWVCEERPSLVAGRTQVSPINCQEYSTEWGACSAQCGLGVSWRVTNQNPYCQLESQSRLCMLRPCASPAMVRAACTPTITPTERIRFQVEDCISVKTFWPTFCGFCGPRPCVPYKTVDELVVFRCASGLTKKRMMFIVSCVCDRWAQSSTM